MTHFPAKRLREGVFDCEKGLVGDLVRQARESLTHRDSAFFEFEVRLGTYNVHFDVAFDLP